MLAVRHCHPHLRRDVFKQLLVKFPVAALDGQQSLLILTPVDGGRACIGSRPITHTMPQPTARDHCTHPTATCTRSRQWTRHRIWHHLWQTIFSVNYQSKVHIHSRLILLGQLTISCEHLWCHVVRRAHCFLHDAHIGRLEVL
jgi:hypothetical protein